MGCYTTLFMEQEQENSVHFLVLAQFPNSFDPQLVESTGINLLVWRATLLILHRTTY